MVFDKQILVQRFGFVIPLGVLSAMAPKMQFAMKSPKSVMKGAVKAKAKGRPRLPPKPRVIQKRKLRKSQPRLQRRKLLKRTQKKKKLVAWISNISIPSLQGLMIQGLNHSGSFTREWQGMIPRRKSLLASGS